MLSTHAAGPNPGSERKLVVLDSCTKAYKKNYPQLKNELRIITAIVPSVVAAEPAHVRDDWWRWPSRDRFLREVLRRQLSEKAQQIADAKGELS